MSIALFIMMAGFIIGLGAVTVIDIHGFLGRKSPYWTEATIRSHKVTKPLIWIGMTLAIIGGVMLYWGQAFAGIPVLHMVLAIALVLNGCFLSFFVSPRLIKREQEGRTRELLPGSLQKKIVASFIISFIGWWGSLALLVVYITTQL